MKLKKIAVRGLIGISVFVALCMFFSGTIESITTPKVKLVQATNGKLEEKVELTGKLEYGTTEEIRFGVGAGQSLTITRADVREGYSVKAGDTIYEATFTGYEAALKQARDDYNDALDAQLEVERKNKNTVLRKSDQLYAEGYAALRTAVRAAASAKVDMEVKLNAAGLKYPDEGYPEGADAAIQAAIDAYRTALTAETQAQSAFDAVSRYGIDDASWAAITEMQAAQEKVDDCEAKLLSIQEQNAAAAAIVAPHDGVIAELKLKAGDPYDGTTTLYTMTADGSSPVLRADLTGVTKTVTEGTGVTIETDKAGELTTKVIATGFSESGAKYADVEITQEMIDAVGSLYNFSTADTKLTLNYKAKQSTCLVPTSAVRGSEKDRYVYTVDESTTTFGKKQLNISKLKVTVLAEAGGTSSLQEDIGYYKIAYMEDRELSDGSAVMEYNS